jgi:RNA methyltransferase, TrmH family
MRPPLKITSADNPRVKSAVRLRDRKERDATGRFLAEGTREVARAIAAGLKPVEFYACQTLLKSQISSALASLGITQEIQDTCQVYDVSESILAKAAYHDRPEGIIGVFEAPIRSLDTLKPPSSKALYLVAVGIEKPGNLGALARTASGAGAHGLIVADGVCDAFNPNAIRASTGAVFTLPIVPGSHQQTLAFLQKHNITLLVSTPSDAAIYTQADMTGSVAIAIGAEDQGLSDDWLAAGKRIRIPMAQSPVDSLNASVAGALLLYEAVRQRSV